jgi:hypothetical protein
MSIETMLIEIANRAGAPTMDYCSEAVLCEQRESLNWIAAKAAEAIKLYRQAPQWRCGEADCHILAPHRHVTI